jgi:hypothetical protein
VDRMQAELARGVERYIFRRVAADPSPLLDDHTREIIAEAVAWAVVHALRAHVVDVPHGDAERRAATPLSLATSR